jgi:hypothetical protein
MDTLPWLEYAGQSTQDLLALASSHRIDSLNCAFDEALQRKEAGGSALTQDETVVLAVEAMQREVNNGGFHQFFTNSSYEYVPIIVESLTRIGAADAAALAAEAISALRLAEVTADAVRAAAEQAIVRNDEELLDALDRCDHQYYRITGLDSKLFAFVQSNASTIQIP